MSGADLAPHMPSGGEHRSSRTASKNLPGASHPACAILNTIKLGKKLCLLGECCTAAHHQIRHTIKSLGSSGFVYLSESMLWTRPHKRDLPCVRGSNPSVSSCTAPPRRQTVDAADFMSVRQYAMHTLQPRSYLNVVCVKSSSKGSTVASDGHFISKMRCSAVCPCLSCQ